MSSSCRAHAFIAVGWVFVFGVAAADDEPLPPAGSALYAERCAACHEQARDRIPSRAQLATRSPEEIAQSLTSGLMRSQSAGLNLNDINALAQLLTGRAPGPELTPPPEQNLCATNQPGRPAAPTDWNGWGRDSDNTRFQPEPRTRTVRPAAPGRQVGLRTARLDDLRPACDRRRPTIRDQLRGARVCARRRQRLHALDLRCRRLGAYGGDGRGDARRD